MNSIAEAWARLGIAATDDKREVKRAYGRALKAIDPETDPRAFLDLREAYEAALQWGTETPYWEDVILDGMAATSAADTEEAELVTVEPADEDWWERWRPDPPAPAGDEGLREACARLDRLLFDDPPPPPDLIVDAGRAVMAHPGLAEVDRLTETELWIAEAISASGSRSDPLIEPAIARFGWKKAERDWRRHYQVASVLARRDALIFLNQCRKPAHVHHLAVKALTGPPPAKLPFAQLDLAGEVSRFLDVVANEHPTLEQDLDPDSLAWWRAYLHGRHLPPAFLVWMLAVPVSLTMAAAFAVTSRGWPLWLLLMVFPLAMLATLGVLLGKAELDARARQRGAVSWGEDTGPSPLVERLAVAGLLLPPLAALLPNGSAWTSLSVTASLVLAAAGLRLGWVEPGWETNERTRLFLPVVAAVLGATTLAQGSADEALKLFAPLLALCWLGSRVYAAMQVRSLAWPRTAWLAVLAASLFCIFLAGGVVFRAALGGSTPLWALLLVPSAIVGGHLAAAASPVEVHYLEWPLRMVALIVYFVTGFLGDDLFWLRLMVAISAYALLYAASLVVSALALEVGRVRSEGT